MFELLSLVLFGWLFIGAVRLAFKMTWGLAKVAAVILFVIALPTFFGFLLLAGGFLLMIPLLLVAAAFGILKACC